MLSDGIWKKEIYAQLQYNMIQSGYALLTVERAL